MSEVSNEIVKKITFKGVAGVPSSADQKEAIKADKSELKNAMCVIGIANGIHITTNQDTGETYEALKGDFLAWDKNKPDVRFAAGLLYLPPIAFELLRGKVESAAAVEFAIEIGTRLPKEGEKSPVGYIYTVKPLIKPEASDPLQKLLAKLEPASEAAQSAAQEKMAAKSAA